MIHRRARLGTALAAALLLAANAAAQTITTPKQHFGFNIGDDYQLATYEQLTAYWRRLDEQSDRMTLVDIGKTAEGRSQWMAIITSPENHRKLEGLKTIARRLALAEDVTSEADARALAESANMNRVLYREWYPQIMYNHHQTGPAGTVMFAPPFRDPANYNLSLIHI